MRYLFGMLLLLCLGCGEQQAVPVPEAAAPEAAPEVAVDSVVVAPADSF